MIDKQKAIDNIIENFDFHRVHSVMDFLEWTWRDDVESPTVGRLVLEAQKGLSNAYDRCLQEKRNINTGSGGFIYRALYEEGVELLELLFMIESWEHYNED